MKLHRGIAMVRHSGINITRVAGEGLEGIPGVLIMISFVFLFAGLFIRRDWFLPIFLAAEAGAAILYILSERHSHKETQWLSRVLHRINE